MARPKGNTQNNKNKKQNNRKQTTRQQNNKKLPVKLPARIKVLAHDEMIRRDYTLQASRNRDRENRSDTRAMERQERDLGRIADTSKREENGVMGLLRKTAAGKLIENRKEGQADHLSTKLGHAVVSNETLRYIATLADPSLDIGEAQPTVNSSTNVGPVAMMRTKVEFTMTNSGAAGASFVALTPGYCGGYSNRPLCTATNSTFAGVTVNTAGPATLDLVYPNTSPHLASAITTLEIYNMRVTGAVLRIRNVTPNLDRGGTIVVWEVLNHAIDGAAGLTFSQLASLPGASVFDSNLSDGEYVEVIWHPQTPQPDALAINESQALAGVEFAHFEAGVSSWFSGSASEVVIMTKDPSAKPQTWECVCYAMYETKGQQVNGRREFSRDAQGHAAAVDAMGTLGARHGILTDAKAWHEQESQAFASPTPIVLDYIDTVVKSAEKLLPIAQNAIGLFGLAAGAV